MPTLCARENILQHIFLIILFYFFFPSNSVQMREGRGKFGGLKIDECFIVSAALPFLFSLSCLKRQFCLQTAHESFHSGNLYIRSFCWWISEVIYSSVIALFTYLMG